MSNESIYKKKNDTYEYYIDILNLILNDMSEASLIDIQDVLDELQVEINKIGEEKNEMPTN